MTRLYIIRHGQSMTSVHNRIADRVGETGLSPLGKEQAARLRDRLAVTREIEADVLIASPLGRSRETAEIIAPSLGLPVQVDEELYEHSFGDADGMDWDEFIAKHEGMAALFRDPFRPLGPGGENLGQYNLRVGTALARLLREYEGKTIVVVAHGGTVVVSFVYFMQFPSLTWDPVDLPHIGHTAITEWASHEQLGPTRWALERYNDYVHLNEHVRWE